MSREVFRLVHPIARRRAAAAVQLAPEGYVVEVREERRTLDQNALLWPLLQDISQQVEWFGKKRSPEDWKDLLSAAFRQCEIVPGIDGRFVVLGLSTSRMGKREFSDFIESIYAFGADKGVEWSLEKETA